MKRALILLGILVSIAMVLEAQHTKPNINFKTTTYDFGELKEADGKVTYSFEFTNSGGQPLVVHNVSASCGCTTPEWSKMPIAPGGKGFVKATFDPANRPGAFNKTITVSSNSSEQTTILRIVGKVTPKPLTEEQKFPVVMGAVRLKVSYLSFTRIAPGASKTESIEVLNPSAKAVALEFENVPAHLSVTANPKVIPAGGKGTIVAVFDAAKKNDWGFVADNIFLTVDGIKDYNTNRISVSATIEEDFSSLTPEQMAKAAKSEYSEKTFDFGTINDGEKVKHDFTVKNTGKTDLVIRKVRASCGCTAVQPAKTLLAPGETTTIGVTFDSKGRPGRQSKTVTVITNDPSASTVLLQITGQVAAK